MGARSNGFGTWIREGGRESGGVNRDFLKNGGGGYGPGGPPGSGARDCR